MTENPPPPGWYPDGEDQQRYWDGSAWTNQVTPTQGVPASGPGRLTRAERKEVKAEAAQQKQLAAQEAAQVRAAEIADARNSGQWWAGTARGMVGGPIYLGPNGRGKTSGIMKLTDDGIRWTSALKKLTIPWAAIEAIDIDGEITRSVTVTRALTVGVFALGAKKRREDCHMSVFTPKSEHAFVFEKTPAVRVRNTMRSVTNALATRDAGRATPEAAETAVHVEETAPAESAASATVPLSTADELAKLAGLRDQGILTDDEFAAAKARLLG